MRKAQIEIVGLLVIVILLLVLSVIFIRFAIRPGSETVAETRKSFQASNLLSALIKTSIDKGSISDLIQDCYVHDCTNLETELKKILELTLPDKEYNLKIYADNREFYALGDCDKGILASQRLKKHNILYKLTLKIC